MFLFSLFHVCVSFTEKSRYASVWWKHWASFGGALNKHGLRSDDLSCMNLPRQSVLHRSTLWCWAVFKVSEENQKAARAADGFPWQLLLFLNWCQIFTGSLLSDSNVGVVSWREEIQMLMWEESPTGVSPQLPEAWNDAVRTAEEASCTSRLKRWLTYAIN